MTAHSEHSAHPLQEYIPPFDRQHAGRVRDYAELIVAEANHAARPVPRPHLYSAAGNCAADNGQSRSGHHSLQTQRIPGIPCTDSDALMGV